MPLLRHSILILITALISVFATSMYYTSHRHDNMQHARNTITALTHGKVSVIKTFPTPTGLQGFIVQTNNANAHRSIIYTSASGKYIIGGPVINEDGTNLTAQEIKRYLHPDQAHKAMAAIDTTHSFLQGKTNATHGLYVIVDPNCIFCHLLYEKLQPMIANGTVAVKWIITGIIKPSSKDKAYAILASKDPVTALAMNEAQFKTATEEGGITPLTSAPAHVKQAIAANENFMRTFGFNGTPVILYHAKDGSAQSMDGMPQGAMLQHIISNSKPL